MSQGKVLTSMADKRVMDVYKINRKKKAKREKFESKHLCRSNEANGLTCSSKFQSLSVSRQVGREEPLSQSTGSAASLWKKRKT